MKKIYLLAIAVFFTCNVFAQTCCYFITNNNDTVHCVKLRITAVEIAVKYKKTDKDKFQMLPSDSVKEYQISKDSSIWRAERLDDTQPHTFLRLIESGKICLLQDTQSSMTYSPFGGFSNSGTTTWYISKNNGPCIMLKSNALIISSSNHSERKNEFADMLADDPPVAADYTASEKFSFNNIERLIEQYNQDMALKGQH